MRLCWCRQREDAGSGQRAAGRGQREALAGAGRRWGKGRGLGRGQALAVLLCLLFSAQEGAAAALWGPAAAQKHGSVSRHLQSSRWPRAAVKPRAWQTAVGGWRAAADERSWCSLGTAR